VTRNILVSTFAVGVIGALSGIAQAQSARDSINIVGSSTVYPFTTTVAEQFGRAGKFKTPKVESTGTGGGIKLFCNGVGPQFPDIANASRRMRPAELRDGARNQGHVGGRDRTEPETTAAQRPDGPHIGHSGPQTARDGRRVRHQGPALFRQPYAPREPIEQRHADGGLQRGYLTRYRRLRVAERAGRRGERLTPRDLQEDFEQRGVHDTSC